ncbi:MAG: TIGR01777 family oxidoreductase [Tepidisphaeraceae bacterium]
MSTSIPKIVLPGGSGFLGGIIAPAFVSAGWDVVILARHPERITPRARVIAWDGRTIGPWAAELEGATAILNLAGRSVNCRYNATNRRTIMDSRIDSTRILGRAIAACSCPPRVWLNSSTATIYRHSLDQPMDESTGQIGSTLEVNDAFSIEVATAWERELVAADTPRTRKLALRTAMVFGRGGGGVFSVLCRLVRLGLGGRMASGRQYVSWIHEHDFCRAIQWLIDHPDVSGPVNLAAPHPVSNADMMRIFRRQCRMPIGLPAARWMLEVGTFLMRTESELVIKSRRVVPGRLLASGFQFRFPDLESTLADLLRPAT